VRLERVTLHRFGCFWHETLDLAAGATLLIGSNDSGKSTLIEAIRALFEDADRFGIPFDRDRVMSRPVSGTPGAWHLPSVSDDTADETDEGDSSGEEDDADPGEVAWVLGEFGDLTEVQQRQWAPVTADGVLRFGAVFASTPDRSGRCLVIDEDSAVGARLAASLDAAKESLDWTDAVSDTGDRTPDDDLWVDITNAALDEVLRDRDGRIWVKRRAVTLLMLSDLWPEPRPPLPLAPNRHSLVMIPGPDAPTPAVDQLLRKLAVESALDSLARAPSAEEGRKSTAGTRSGATTLDLIWDRLDPLGSTTAFAIRLVGGGYSAGP
jgi:energy-coupling factor transporter ATP-binding protein EcfA2